MKCVITGAALISNDVCVAGDLFELGDHYVFIGNQDAEGKPKWIPKTKCGLTRRMEPGHWALEKRGIFFVQKKFAGLNDHAMKYLAGGA